MDKIRHKFLSCINDEKITDRIIETGVHPSRIRSLLYNLRKFPHLREDLVSGKLSPEYFAKEMQPTEMLPYVYSGETERVIKDERDGLIKCESCSSMKTEYTEIHSLEYTSILVYCKDCGNTNKL